MDNFDLPSLNESLSTKSETSPRNESKISYTKILKKEMQQNHDSDNIYDNNELSGLSGTSVELSNDTFNSNASSLKKREFRKNDNRDNRNDMRENRENRENRDKNEFNKQIEYLNNQLNDLKTENDDLKDEIHYLRKNVCVCPIVAKCNNRVSEQIKHTMQSEYTIINKDNF